ncbi:MAG TPA: AI-2E family transporter, partial [Nonomuraea sp.]|nr:AI-2E family transporter [Nonomuraea sp.]
MTTPPAPESALLPPANGSASTRSLFERDWRQALTILLTVLAAMAVIWILWTFVVSPILRTLIVFLMAGLLAFILDRPVQDVTDRFGGRRVFGILAVYLCLAAVVVGGLLALAGPFVSQATALFTDLPGYASDIQSRAPEVQTQLGRYGIQASLDELKTRGAELIQTTGTDLLKHLITIATEVGSVIVDVLLALVIAFYFLMDGPQIRQRVLNLVPTRHRSKALFVEENVTRVLGGYLRGQLILALTIGVVTALGLTVLGVPYALVLGVMAGMFELVPMFGPILSAMPALIIAAFLPFPTVLWVLLFFILVQQVENNVLVPRISGHAVGLHPLGAMFALIAGFQFAGLLGAL